MVKSVSKLKKHANFICHFKKRYYLCSPFAQTEIIFVECQGGKGFIFAKTFFQKHLETRKRVLPLQPLREGAFWVNEKRREIIEIIL